MIIIISSEFLNVEIIILMKFNVTKVLMLLVSKELLILRKKHNNPTDNSFLVNNFI